MPDTSPFLLTDLPQGWSVSWPGWEFVVANTPRKVHTLLKIVLEELGQAQADLAVINTPRDGSTTYHTTYSIGILQWYQADQQREYICEDLSRRFFISGVRFPDQATAERFRTHMEQRLAWRRLGGQWR